MNGPNLLFKMFMRNAQVKICEKRNENDFWHFFPNFGQSLSALFALLIIRASPYG